MNEVTEGKITQSDVFEEEEERSLTGNPLFEK
jgi:hypothetical protein